MTFTRALATNNYGPAKFIVDGTTVANGTHSTIASALTSASSGDTIFIRPGTYTENITLKAGVNLAAYDCDAITPNVTINGTCSFSAAGTVSISGICLQTNTSYALSVTGSAASIVNLKDCYLNCTNANGATVAINLASTSSSSKIQLFNCKGNLITTGITYFSNSSTGGAIKLWGGNFENDGASTDASTCSGSGAGLNLYNTFFYVPITTSSTSSFSIHNSHINGTMTVNGTGTNIFTNSIIYSSTASAISIGASAVLTASNVTIDSTNTNAITGAGTLNYAGIVFTNTSKKINTTTQTGGTLHGGLTQAPSAGFLGERLSSAATSVSYSAATATNCTSVSITAGVWDISANLTIISGNFTSQSGYMSISTTSATIQGNYGDQKMTAAYNGSNFSFCISAFRVVLTSTTTYYLVGQCDNSTSGTLNGRISATRVG